MLILAEITHAELQNRCATAELGLAGWRNDRDGLRGTFDPVPARAFTA